MRDASVFTEQFSTRSKVLQTMAQLEDVVERFADKSSYRENAEKFLNLNRWTGDDPVLLLADAAGTTTGQNYFDQVKPSVEKFRDRFLKTGRVNSFESLSQFDEENEELKNIFEARRKRHVLLKGADLFTEVDRTDDLVRLQEWANNADPHNYSQDPFGSIRGVGLRTFQYLRMIAGVDTVKPDIQVKRFVEAVSEATDDPSLDASSDQRVLESCGRISSQTGYRMIELDQIAWWEFSNADERHVK